MNKHPSPQLNEERMPRQLMLMVFVADVVVGSLAILYIGNAVAVIGAILLINVLTGLGVRGLRSSEA